MARLLEKLQLAKIDGSIASCFDRLAALDLLIIDVFGMKKLDGQQLLDFMEVIEDRHERRSTIISSQLPISDWYDVLEKNATIADAILDRLAKSRPGKNNVCQSPYPVTHRDRLLTEIELYQSIHLHL